MEILGIDIGGSGIKGAVVDTVNGHLVGDRHRIETPQPSKPDAIAQVVKQLHDFFGWSGPIGCTFPAIMKHGVAYSAANVDPDWIGMDAEQLFRRETACPVKVLNDADAAGIAEMRFGAGRGRSGVVMIITVGTGIGSAIFVNGHLLPNSELGHLELRGKVAEQRASDRIRQEKDLSWEKWARRLSEYLNLLEFLFSPDLFILGGGVSRKYDEFSPYLALDTEILPAQLRNEAGIIGAALVAEELV